MSLSSHQEVQILHVDDDPSITDLTEAFLEREDDRFAVETATSADEGLERINDRPPDCVVSDYNMPGMDGIEFLRAVREEHPDLPFILYTGKGSEAVASEAIAADVTDYLQKESGSEQYELLANRIRNAVRARREAERADRQEQLMRLTEFAGETGGFEVDVDSGDLLLTDGTRRLVGLSDDAQITLEEAIELYHPDDQADVRQTVTQAAEAGEETRGTWRLQTLDGDERLVDVTMVPATENDDVTTLRGAVHDITERRRRERRFQALVKESNDVISIIDADGVFQYQSPSLERILGHDPAETIGEQVWEYIHPEDRERVSDEFEAWVNNSDRTVKYSQYRARHADGTWHWMEANGSDQLTNPAVEGYVVTSRDITDRKERQQELERTQELIVNMEELADAGAWEYDSESEQLMITDGTRRLYGLDSEASLTLEEALDAVHPDDRDLLADRFNNCLETGDPYEMEVRLTPPDGEQRWIIARGERVSESETGSVLRGYIRDITDRKERERELIAERRFIEQALDTLDDLFYVFDVDGSLRRWNDRAAEVTGYTDSELDGKQVIEMFPEDEHSTVANAVQMAVTGEKVTVEADLLTADGQRVPYEFTGARLTDETGEITGIVGIGRDLTERQQRDRRIQFLQTLANELTELSIDFLRTEERDIDTLINGTLEKIGTFVDADRTYIFDVDHEAETLSNTYEWCSEGVEPQIDTLQDLPQEALPWWTQKLKNSDDIIIPKVSELPPEAEAEQELLQEQNIESLIVTPMTSNDKLVGFVGFDWVEEQDVWSGEFINILCMVSELITTARRRKEREQELRELTSQYETLVKNFPDGAVYLIDTNLECVRAGGDELRNVGLSPEDIEGTTPHDLFPAEIADELCHYYDEAFDGTASAFEQEYDGEQYRIQTVPVRIDGEEINYVMAVAQNVSERVENKRTLERQNERLEEFASIISHDLRNPLRVADGRLELIREECESDHIDDVAQALERMDTLIEDLLTLAREGEQVGETEPVGLADVAKTSWQTVNTEQATLETDTTQTIQADRSRLQQLFENLYRNAVEHGGEDVTVSVGATDEGFYVADTGLGIPESDRGEVFEAGYSTNEDGTGFGLRIVKQIADAHEWEISVAETEGDGTRLEITGVEKGA